MRRWWLRETKVNRRRVDALRPEKDIKLTRTLQIVLYAAVAELVDASA